MRVSVLDLLRLGLEGAVGRPARAALSVLGIAVAVTTLVVVTGVPASGQRALLDEMTALGSDMLQVDVRSAQDTSARLPETAAAMVERVGPVRAATQVANTQASVRRNDLVDASGSVGVSVLAAQGDLLTVVRGTVSSGRFLDDVPGTLPVVVLGDQAARWLGVTRLPDRGPLPQVVVGDGLFTVVGILDPVPLAPAVDQSVLVGWDAARTSLGFDGHPTVVYLTSDERALEDVRAVLPATLSPDVPGLVQVSRPSDVLLAKRQTESTFSGLFVGLAGVSLLVGGIGIANTMVISVLERRREIGLRRALGATRGHVRAQFLVEAALLAGAGGAVGAVLGCLGTAAYAVHQGWPVVVEPPTLLLGLAGSVGVGVAAGLYPAVRASRLSPTEALSVG